MKRALTDRLAKSIIAQSGARMEVVDTVQPGLRLRVTPTGVKTWSVALRVSGRMRRFTVGGYPELGVAEARRRAARLIVEVKDGRDPVDEARAARQAIKIPKAVTLAQGLDFYSATKLRHLRSGNVIERDLRRDLSDLMELPVSTITQHQLAAIVSIKAVSAPIMANRLVAHSKPFFRWLRKNGHIEHDPAFELEKPVPERIREHVLSDSDITAIWRATAEMKDLWRVYFRVLLLSCTRREETAGMRWSELNLDTSEWCLPAIRTKPGKAITIPLPAPAIDELKRLKESRGRSGLVFTTTKHSPISGFSKAKRKLDELSGISGWRLHDLRRSAVSQMAKLGIDPAVADRCLNHVGASTMSSVARVYQQSDMLERRRHALESWADHVLRVAGKFGQSY